MQINKISNANIISKNFTSEQNTLTSKKGILTPTPSTDSFEKKKLSAIEKISISALIATGLLVLTDLIACKGDHLKAIFKGTKNKTDNIIKNNIDDVSKNKSENIVTEISEKEFVETKLNPLINEIAQIRIELKNTYNRILKGENVPAEEVESVLNKYCTKQSEYVNLEWNASTDFGHLFENKHSIFADKLDAYLLKLKK